MKLATRYGLAGIGGLALLSIGHWLRERGFGVGQQSGEYLLGVLPNFAAAIAITFVLLSIWADQDAQATRRAGRLRFLLCATTSGLGLVAWELLQRTGRRLVFDPHDILATMLGLGAAGLMFYVLAPKPTENASQSE